MNITDMLTYNDFIDLPEDEQKEKLTLYRNMFTNKQIMDRWGINITKLYTLIDKHQLPKSDRNKRKTSKQRKNNVSKKVETVLLQEHLPVKPVETEPVEGYALMLKGTYSAEQLIHRLERTVFMLLDEEADFEIEMKIKEKV